MKHFKIIETLWRGKFPRILNVFFQNKISKMSTLKALLPLLKYMNPLIVSMKLNGNKLLIDKLITLISLLINTLLLLLFTYFTVQGYYSSKHSLLPSQKFSNYTYIIFIICRNYAEIAFSLHYENLINLWNQILNLMDKYNGFNSNCISQQILIFYTFTSQILIIWLWMKLFIMENMALNYFAALCLSYFANNNQTQVALIQYFTLVNIYKKQFKKIHSDITISIYNKEDECLLLNNLTHGAIAHQELFELMNLTVKVSSLHLMTFVINTSLTLSVFLFYILEMILQGSVINIAFWYVCFPTIDAMVRVLIIINSSETCKQEVSNMLTGFYKNI